MLFVSLATCAVVPDFLTITPSTFNVSQERPPSTFVPETYDLQAKKKKKKGGGSVRSRLEGMTHAVPRTASRCVILSVYPTGLCDSVGRGRSFVRHLHVQNARLQVPTRGPLHEALLPAGEYNILTCTMSTRKNG